jgi:hypothetical protein
MIMIGPFENYTSFWFTSKINYYKALIIVCLIPGRRSTEIVKKQKKICFIFDFSRVCIIHDVKLP